MAWAVSWYLSNRTAPGLRARVAKVALSEVGTPNGLKYIAAEAPSAASSTPYCGLFVLWVAHRALPRSRAVKWVMDSGISGKLQTTNSPEIGDIAYFDRNQHHAVIVGITPDKFQLVNGNGTGGGVTLTETPRTNVRAVFSIQPWLG